ncbi:MAG TPA: hypothetical protein VLO11_15235, partial [Luteolibacter sp.]|nr:hypothetical protein [Luteolibacter sp.]
MVSAFVGLLAFYGLLYLGNTGFTSEDKLSWRWYPVELTLRYADREMAYAQMSREFPPPLRMLIAWDYWPGAKPDDYARGALEECAS